MTEIRTLKATCSPSGTWVLVPMILIKTQAGWAERPADGGKP